MFTYDKYPANPKDTLKQKLKSACGASILDYLEVNDPKYLTKSLEAYEKYCSAYYSIDMPPKQNLQTKEIFGRFAREIEDICEDNADLYRITQYLIKPMASIGYEFAYLDTQKAFYLNKKSLNEASNMQSYNFDDSNIELLNTLYDKTIANKFNFIKSGEYHAQMKTYKNLDSMFGCAINTADNRNDTILMNLCNEIIGNIKYLENLTSIQFSSFEKDLKKLDLEPIKNWQSKKIGELKNISDKKLLINNFEQLVSSLQIYSDEKLMNTLYDTAKVFGEDEIKMKALMCHSPAFAIDEKIIDDLYEKTNNDLEYLFYSLSSLKKEELYNYLLEKYGYEKIFKDLQKCDKSFKDDIGKYINEYNKELINGDLSF